MWFFFFFASLFQPAGSRTQPAKNINKNTPSLNISDPSGLVLVASQNPSGELVLNRISNGPSTQQSAMSHSNAPGAPVVQCGSSSLGGVSLSTLSDTNSFHGSAQKNATFVVSSQMADGPFRSHPIPVSQNSTPHTFTSPSLQMAHSSSQITASSFVATDCKLSSGNVMQQGNSTSNPLGSVLFLPCTKTEGFCDKDSSGLKENSGLGSGIQDVNSSPSFHTLFPKNGSSFSRYDAMDINKSSIKMDICSNVCPGDQTSTSQHQELSHISTSSLTDSLMAGPSRIQQTDKEVGCMVCMWDV